MKVRGPSLLLIHDIPVWGYLWKDCLTPLAAHFRVIIHNLVGYGYSDQRDSFDRSIKVQTCMLAGLLNHLQIERLFVAGHDIGGAVALNTNHMMELLADLHKLTIPLLLLWGEKDQFQPLATAKRFHHEFLQTELQVIPDSDHFLPLEKGPGIAQILLNYLKGSQPT